MATRKHCVAIALRRPGRAAGPEEIELGDDDLVEVAPSGLGAFAAADPELFEVTSVDVDLGALVVEPSPPTPWRGTPRLGLGKETMQVLGPLMVKQLARPAAPPPRFPRSAGLLAAAAAVATVLLTASAALAFS